MFILKQARQGEQMAIGKKAVKTESTGRPETLSHFRFLDLPPEIRLIVYDLLLIQPGRDVTLRYADYYRYRHENREAVMKEKHPAYVARPYPQSVLAILGVCRRIRNEASPIFYRGNCLNSLNVTNLGCFLGSLSLERRSYIRHVRFEYRGKRAPAAFRLLKTCENLRTLQIRVDYRTLRPRRPSLLKAWGMNDLRRIRGLEKLHIEYDPSITQDDKAGFEETLRAALLRPKIVRKTPGKSRKRKVACLFEDNNSSECADQALWMCC